MQHTYFIRYGLMRHVGRFASSNCRDQPQRGSVGCQCAPFEGMELGEVLGPTTPAAPRDAMTTRLDIPHVLRVAGPEDIELARRDIAGGGPPRRFFRLL